MSDPQNLKNSELHHKVKNQTGEDGDETHMQPDAQGTLSSDVKDAIKETASDTQLAEELKAAVRRGG